MKINWPEFIVTAILGVLFVLFYTWLVQHLWNLCIPEIFGFKELSFIQCFRLLILFNLLKLTSISKEKGALPRILS
jgi:hypothetical protein